MNYERLGLQALGLTWEALECIRRAQAGDITVTQEPNPYVRGGFSPTTPADLAAERIYTRVLEPVVAEEKDPERSPAPIAGRGAWVVDGIDGTTLFIEGALFGYGTQCAYVDEHGIVRVAFVGDATTGDVFGYYGDSGVFRIDGEGNRSLISQVDRSRPLRDHVGLRRPSIEQYDPRSQELLLSGRVGDVSELLGGIGTTMARLLTDEIALFALRGHHERPWDANPPYALCVAAGMVFMTPTATGFREWRPFFTLETYKRDFDLLVMHRSRVPEFLEAAAAMR